MRLKESFVYVALVQKMDAQLTTEEESTRKHRCSLQFATKLHCRV